MTEHSELVLRIEGRITWMLWTVMFPVALLMRQSGTTGRFAVIWAVVGWLVGGGVFFAILDLTVVRWFLDLPGGTVMTTWFIALCGGLGLLEACEVLCRKYPADQIIGTATGEPRFWIWDWWLPETLSQRELILRVIEPASVAGVGVYVGRQDPLLGTYLVTAGVCDAVLGNLLFLRERYALHQLKDSREIGKRRIDAIGDGDKADVPSAGEARLAFTPPTHPAAKPGIPRPYLELEPELRQMLDWETIEAIYAPSARDHIPVQCDHCSVRMRATRTLLGEKVRCPRCEKPFTVTHYQGDQES
ncbi:MAG: hypothetical protein AAGG48_17525 [Planctomycetota bacterium]